MRGTDRGAPQNEGDRWGEPHRVRGDRRGEPHRVRGDRWGEPHTMRGTDRREPQVREGEGTRHSRKEGDLCILLFCSSIFSVLVELSNPRNTVCPVIFPPA